MSDTVFTKVDYDLSTLMHKIRLGEIGLPEIQRPFVWKNTKVRDLFDSMYSGYPIGHLLLWQTDIGESVKMIGTDKKQKAPKLVIVDGQQRLTSLYAVMNNIKVVKDNFEKEHIQIAFNPLEEKFAVADAAVRKDRAFIPSISVLWSKETDLFEVVDEYLKRLCSSREVSREQQKSIKKAISKLQKLESFPFTALELASDVDEEAVAEVFVRVNSRGTTLKQSDFILTLMSVFWDEGRTELEQFCRSSRRPSDSTPSPFNRFLKPSPDQLLRVAIGVAFKRARLKFVYSILRGKDLKTKKFSDELRVQQFDRLKDAQSRTLDLKHWHDFFSSISLAGFKSTKMISSKNNLLFSYMLYLIGRTEYKVPEFELRKAIARWFFMSAVTGRFTGSPETRMENDLAKVNSSENADEFVRVMDGICEVSLTGDFWNVSLPNALESSSSQSPSLYAYHAAQVLLLAPALYSESTVSDLLDPIVHSSRSSLERHHLFPRKYLESLGFKGTKEINQIANYALMSWKDNLDVSSKPPSEYAPNLEERFNDKKLKKMYTYNALPENWHTMEYPDFLEQRRVLMAKLIEQAYNSLVHDEYEKTEEEEFDITEALQKGESKTFELKSTLRVNLHTGNKDPRMEKSVLKTLAAFMNTEGGTLVVGIADDGSPVGVSKDNFENEDRMYLHLMNLVKSRLGVSAVGCIDAEFHDYEGNRVMVIKTLKSRNPVVLEDNNKELFFIRTGPSTTELSVSEAHGYMNEHFN